MLVSIAVMLVIPVGTAAAAPPTRSELIRKGDALCSRTAVLLRPVRARAQPAKSLPDAQKWTAVASVWTEQIRIQQWFTTQFKAIGVPTGDAKARSFAAGLDRGLLLARSVQRAFADRSTTRAGVALPAYVNFTLGFNQTVRTYGFRVCGR